MKEYTRYERTRLIGARALQISRGAPAMVKTKIRDPIAIAQLEFEKGVIPMDVRMKEIRKHTNYA
jgi:DNA-directed RNA polymerase subunit K